MIRNKKRKDVQFFPIYRQQQTYIQYTLSQYGHEIHLMNRIQNRITKSKHEFMNTWN